MISILCPTRGRPDQFEAMCESAFDTADSHLVEVISYIDDDDPARQDYKDIEAHYWPQQRSVSGPRICMSDMWNRCAAAADGDVLMQCGDDIRFRTQGWDALVLDAFGRHVDGLVFVHGRDLSPHDGIHGTHGFVSRRWYQTLGYMVPTGFVSDYTDTWLNDIANKIGRRVYLENLVTEHLHYTLGKAAIDENTRDRIARHEAQRPDLLYAETAQQRIDDAEKLSVLLGTAA